jgi:hypothetical protein
VPPSDDPLQAWESLPKRIYLDTGTLQALFDYGDVIWESEAFVRTARAAKVAGLSEEVEALRRIFTVNERAQFEFVVTQASLREVISRGRPGYTQWVHDVLDTWRVQSDDAQPPTAAAAQKRLGSVSENDWQLLDAAMALECDAFLTMERRLATQADVIERRTGIRVMRPTGYWDLLGPWATLFT